MRVSLGCLVVLATSGLIAGCSGSTQIVVPPPPPPAGVTLTFRPNPEDLTPAQRLGWANGLPGLAVTLTPASGSSPRSFHTEGDGTLSLSDLPAGTYSLEASRWLTSAERAQLDPGDDVTGFVTRQPITLSGSGGQTILVPANRRHGLVIAEWAFNLFAYTGGEIYPFAGFVILFNNADTTMYLDGMIFGEGWSSSFDAGVSPCSATKPWRDDPAGIWTRTFQRFPGTGRDHPIGPGGRVVIATDAIDHRELFPGKLDASFDLSHADFEFVGTADVDNPSVPNMLDAGPTAYPRGHGLQFSGPIAVPFLAVSVDLASLPRGSGVNGVDNDWARIPADRVVDALAMGTNYPPPAGPADCPPLVNNRFDRLESRVRGTDEVIEHRFSVTRLTAPSEGGSPRLQWTRTSAADFIRTPRSSTP